MTSLPPTTNNQNVVHSVKQLTLDNSKILGRTTEKRRQKAVPDKKFSSRNFKTINSGWTPQTHKATNEQIFKERRELVCNWFDIWSDSQRRRFLDRIFHHCRRNQYLFVQDWFRERVPLKHVDFTKLLPRFLSLYVFSFLDPMSLSRASKVCWHWKFLTEQDVLWIPKAERLGWFLPYTPPDSEYGAWKRHYIACTKTLDMTANAQTNGSDLYGMLSDGTKWVKAPKTKTTKMDPQSAREVLESRPPWQPPDKNPQDMAQSQKALLDDYNPNDPKLHPALLMHHDKFGLPKNPLTHSLPGPIRRQQGLESTARKKMHRLLNTEDDPDLSARGRRALLSQSLDLEQFEERRMMELTHQLWEPPAPDTRVKHGPPDLSGGGDYPLPWKHGGIKGQAVSKSFPSDPNPRVIFISSRIPAADVLVDAVLFGVIPLVYEYEGTTLESLKSRLDRALQGRYARSVGVFVHCEVPWEMQLVQGACISLDTLDNPQFKDFFENLATSVMPPQDNGHVDLFLPMASAENGREMMTQLNILTGMTFTSPTGTMGNYNHIDSKWSAHPEGVAPPEHYFCSSKLALWSRMADQVHEACVATKALVSRYFEQKHRDVVSQLVGQIIFDATGQVAVQGLSHISDTLVQALVNLGHEKNVGEPLEYLGQYLLETSLVKQSSQPHTALTATSGGTLRPGATMSAAALSQHLELDEQYEGSNTDTDGEVAQINKRGKEEHNQRLQQEEEEEESVILTEEEGVEERYSDTDMTPKEVISSKYPVSFSYEEPGDYTSKSMDKSMTKSTLARPKPIKLGPTKSSSEPVHHQTLLATARTRSLEGHGDERTSVAKETLSSERDYLRTLCIIRDVYFQPCKASHDSNRAMISAHNMQIIFTDPLRLLQLSKELYEDLQPRLDGWSQQECLADIFIKFSVNLKAYVNYLNNYPTILTTVEKCQEQSAQFRALLKRQEKRAESKMLPLAGLLLTPVRRVGQWVQLLTRLKACTPEDHADRADLDRAIKIYNDLDQLIRDSKLRCERERELMMLQKKIYGSPVLLESSRFFIRQLDVARLKPVSDKVQPELRTYHHVETLGLFLFNDGLVVTRRTTHHLPYEHSHEYHYKFDACASLTRLRVEDIPDSKFVRNALRLYTPRRSWVCAADSYDDKFNWMSLLERTVNASLTE